MYYVYILKSRKSGYLYVGYTSDLKERVSQHNSRKNRSTKAFAPYDLPYYEAYASEVDARKREAALKHRGQAKARLLERLRQSLLSARPSTKRV